MKKQQHFHKYERMQWPNGSYFYKCMESGCSHYLSVPYLVIGRESICWGDCNRVVTITKQMVFDKIKHPMCDACREERKEKREALIATPEEE